MQWRNDSITKVHIKTFWQNKSNFRTIADFRTISGHLLNFRNFKTTGSPATCYQLTIHHVCYIQSQSCSIVIIRAHSFPWQILPNSAGQFAKFRGSPQQNCSNSASRYGHPFVSKLNSIRSKKLQLLKAGVLLSYASNIQRKLSIIFSF